MQYNLSVILHIPTQFLFHSVSCTFLWLIQSAADEGVCDQFISFSVGELKHSHNFTQVIHIKVKLRFS